LLIFSNSLNEYERANVPLFYTLYRKNNKILYCMKKLSNKSRVFSNKTELSATNVFLRNIVIPPDIVYLG